MKQLVCLLAMCITALLCVYLVTLPQQKGSVEEAIEARRSVRVYEDRMVEREKLQRLAELGGVATYLNSKTLNDITCHLLWVPPSSVFCVTPHGLASSVPFSRRCPNTRAPFPFGSSCG